MKSFDFSRFLRGQLASCTVVKRNWCYLALGAEVLRSSIECEPYDLIEFIPNIAGSTLCHVAPHLWSMK